MDTDAETDSNTQTFHLGFPNYGAESDLVPNISAELHPHVQDTFAWCHTNRSADQHPNFCSKPDSYTQHPFAMDLADAVADVVGYGHAVSDVGYSGSHELHRLSGTDAAKSHSIPTGYVERAAGDF
jgi:hypothetical protein